MHCAALGGRELAEAAREIIVDNDGLAIMGFVQPLLRLGEFIALGNRLRDEITKRRPRVVVSCDYPGFNLRLQRRLQPLRASGTRLIHMVAPQVWAAPAASQKGRSDG